jgi:hypothetical protein
VISVDVRPDLTKFLSASSVNAIKLDKTNSRIFLPKLGWLRYRNSRHILGEVRNVAAD